MKYAEMSAGLELDALIAEKVMGAVVYDRQVQGTAKRESICLRNGDHLLKGAPYQFPADAENDKWYYQYEYWSPSTDIRCAWTVLEALVARGYTFEVFARGAKGWGAASGPKSPPDVIYHPMLAFGETAPLAICRAALQVLIE